MSEQRPEQDRAPDQRARSAELHNDPDLGTEDLEVDPDVARDVTGGSRGAEERQKMDRPG